jgi:hypothetical protein
MLGESLCCDWDRCNQSLEIYHANHTLRKAEVHYKLQQQHYLYFSRIGSYIT